MMPTMPEWHQGARPAVLPVLLHSVVSLKGSQWRSDSSVSKTCLSYLQASNPTSRKLIFYHTPTSRSAPSQTGCEGAGDIPATMMPMRWDASTAQKIGHRI
ncbi:hypothetical protein EDC04DRAFT_430483 [Pisolithus marmoratus]|nr:hypothetical protein EDC04DRAFT_430483 [Pisolithus marmoratus]